MNHTLSNECPVGLLHRVKELNTVNWALELTPNKIKVDINVSTHSPQETDVARYHQQ
jgi:hypothetical protein